jgi:GT2 family glycosyltransferase
MSTGADAAVQAVRGDAPIRFARGLRRARKGFPTVSTPPPRPNEPTAPGVVVIGRNEGERLVRCLDSLSRTGSHAHGGPGIGRGVGPVVYVDSGSSDGSREAARARSALVVELDPQQPFTAARARNAGFERLLEAHPDVELVQFVDGDCELVGGWLERGAAELARDADLAVVCGRRKERHPEASVYNRLCDMEWNTPVGEVDGCGGDALMRAAAFRAVGGFDPDVIAGEEPELCVRLRAAGWRIRRIDAPMTLHDAAMTRFGQWWRRALRHGHAAAESVARHGGPGERADTRRVASALVWAVLAPGALIVASILAIALPSLALAAIAGTGFGLAYGRLVWRIVQSRRGRGDRYGDAALYALFCVLGKLPETVGVLRYHADRRRGRGAAIIEYK